MWFTYFTRNRLNVLYDIEWSSIPDILPKPSVVKDSQILANRGRVPIKNESNELWEKATNAIADILKDPEAIKVFLTDKNIYKAISDGWINGKVEPSLVVAFIEKVVDAYRQLWWVMPPSNQVGIIFNNSQLAHGMPVLQLTYAWLEAKTFMNLNGSSQLISMPWMWFGPSTETPLQTVNRLTPQVDQYFMSARNNILWAMQNVNNPRSFQIISAYWNMINGNWIPILTPQEKLNFMNAALIPRISQIPNLVPGVIAPEYFLPNGLGWFKVGLMTMWGMKYFDISAYGATPLSPNLQKKPGK